MQVGSSFLSAALQKQTESGFYIQLHIDSGALSEMSSSSCMQGSVCPQLPLWRTSATKPAQSCLYPPSTAMLTAHLPSPPEGITALEQKGSPHALAQLCSRLEVHLFTGKCLFLWPSLTTKCKMQSCYFPRQTQERKHPLAAPVSSSRALSSRDSLLLSNTLLQMAKCQFPLCQD